MSDQACTSREHQIVDALFGDIDGAGLEALHAHFAVCPGCAKAYEQMQQALSVVLQSPEPEVPEAYWDSYYERLQARMAPRTRRLQVSERWKRLGDWLERTLIPRPAVLQWSIAIALLLVGVFIGRQWNASTSDLAGEHTQAAPAGAALTPVALNEKTEEYLDRSKVLLLGLVNFDVEEDDPAFMILDSQQHAAGELIQEAVLLKEELDQNDEQELVSLIEELQLILLQIANLEKQEDVPAIELIQHGVDQGALLLKINLEKMKLSEREEAPRTNAAASESGTVF